MMKINYYTERRIELAQAALFIPVWSLDVIKILFGGKSLAFEGDDFDPAPEKLYHRHYVQMT
jgi:hypothetical protein